MKDLSHEVIQEVAKHLSKIESFEFNVFDLDKIIGKRAIYFVLDRVFAKYSFFKSRVEEKKFLSFSEQLIEGYNRNVPYHNDLHGVDVLQTTYIQLEKGGLIRVNKII